MEIAILILTAIATVGAIYGIVQLAEHVSKQRRLSRLAQRQRAQSSAPTGPFRLLNFSHPITPLQREAIERQLKTEIEDIVERPSQLLHDGAFDEQVTRIVNGIPVSSEQWQASRFVVNLPGFSPAAAVLLAELHGRMGHFPTIIRLRPIPNSSPQVYELAEIINLQAVRDQARGER